MEERLTKDEARKKLRRAESDLRQAEIVMEMHENGVRELREDIEKLKAIINKKDSWRSVRVSDSWEELYEEKALLMADMMHFAYVRNEGWMPDWEDYSENKYGLYAIDGKASCSYNRCHNDFVFGIAVKSREIAEEMLAEFGERIEKVYNKQY